MPSPPQITQRKYRLSSSKLTAGLRRFLEQPPERCPVGTPRRTMIPWTRPAVGTRRWHALLWLANPRSAEPATVRGRARCDAPTRPLLSRLHPHALSALRLFLHAVAHVAMLHGTAAACGATRCDVLQHGTPRCNCARLSLTGARHGSVSCAALTFAPSCNDTTRGSQSASRFPASARARRTRSTLCWREGPLLASATALRAIFAHYASLDMAALSGSATPGTRAVPVQ